MKVLSAFLHNYNSSEFSVYSVCSVVSLLASFPVCLDFVDGAATGRRFAVTASAV